jgi:MFS transporter, DHA1 family, multidrug resistance protein
MSMVMPFLPLYVRELGVTSREGVKLWSGLIFAAPFMVAVFLQPLWGILGDRYGRKPMVVRGMSGMALAMFLMGFARSAPQLLALRFFQGTISGFVAPSLALLASCTPPEKTGQALGTLQSGMVTGFILGPLLGGFLAHYMGYRAIFFWTALFCLLGVLTVIKFVKEIFVKQEKARGSGLQQNLRTVFHSPELRAMLLLLILVQMSVQLVAPFLSLYVEYLKVSPEYLALVTGLVFGVTGVTNALGSPLWGKRADQIGYRKVLWYCLIGMTLSYLPQAFVTGAVQLLLLRAALGVFVGGVQPTINTIVQRSTTAENRGGIYGIFMSGLLVGNVAGPLLGGVLSASFGLRPVFLITTGILVFALLLQRNSNRAQS